MIFSVERGKILHLDIETYSDEDISSVGVFRYVESPVFQILLIAFAYDDGPVHVLDLTGPDIKAGMPIYDQIIADLTDPEIIKVAHNAQFERTCFGEWTGIYQPLGQWEDSMVLAAYNGLPLSLDGVGAALALKDQKIKEGTSLINYFCKPCAPTKANGGRTRNLPAHAPEKWERFMEYCRRDVEVERAVYERLRGYKPTAKEIQVRQLDDRINRHGVMIDKELAEAALEIDTKIKDETAARMHELTGLENPNSVAQLKDWLEHRGVSVGSLGKEQAKDLAETSLDPLIREVMQLRLQIGKTSTAKYEAMLRAVCKDGAVRGIQQYYGAGRTGRWAGRLVQLQNLPQNHLENIGLVRELVKAKDVDFLKMMFDSVPDVLSQLIRTALIARPGTKFLVADYSAIEARVIAYLAGETWRQNVFAAGGDIYCRSAENMFHVPVEKHGVNSELRAKGKIAELACGYGGGVGALKAFGADKMGLSDKEMQDIVSKWRLASPNIPKLWTKVETAAREAILSPGKRVRVINPITGDNVCEYRRDQDALRCTLPSGRVLSYWDAGVDDEGTIRFMAQNQTTRKWERTQTWGGKLVENIVQAFARDCLAQAMLDLDACGYAICFHVHDEVIAEVPETWPVEDMAEIMSRPIPWAPGLILNAEGYETPFYLKD